MITVADLVAYRRRHEKLVERVVSTKLPTALRRLRGRRLPLAGGQQAPRGPGQGRCRRRVRRARPRPLRVPDRRRVPLAALRLRRAARVGAGHDRARGLRRAALPLPGGAGHRPAQQAPGLQAPGGGPGHRRRQPAPGPARGPARLRDRRPDPRRPGAARASGSSPTTPRRSPAWPATACRSPTRSPSSTLPTPTTRRYLRAKREKLGHTLHHQGLALDEEMLEREHEQDRQPPRWPAERRVALCVARFYAELADKLEEGARAALDEAGVTTVESCSGARRLRAAAGGQVRRRVRAL